MRFQLPSATPRRGLPLRRLDTEVEAAENEASYSMGPSRDETSDKEIMHVMYVLRVYVSRWY